MDLFFNNNNVHPPHKFQTIEWPVASSTDDMQEEPPWAKYLTKRQMLPIEEVSEKTSISTSAVSRPRKASSKSSAKSDTSEPTKLLEPPQHLTLGSMATGSRILVSIKCALKYIYYPEKLEMSHPTIVLLASQLLPNCITKSYLSVPETLIFITKASTSTFQDDWYQDLY